MLKTKIENLILFFFCFYPILLFTGATQQVANEEGNFLSCAMIEDSARSTLGEECDLLRLFNATKYEEMDFEDRASLAVECACQLADMNQLWIQCFLEDPSAYKLAHMVEDAIQAYNNKSRTYPPYLWTDLDFTINRISIYTATKDYFDKQKRMRFSPRVRKEIDNDEVFRSIKITCLKVAKDECRLFRYLENLSRMNPYVLFRLIEMVDSIRVVYYAAKACKLPLNYRISSYKLRVDNEDLVVAEPTVFQLETTNSIQNDIDLMLNDESARLLDCASWQERKLTLRELAEQCPMMINGTTSMDWNEKHNSSLARSEMALKCGCQLLSHNSTWLELVENPNVKVMAKALTNYINHKGVPDFATTPIWSIHGWFLEIMSDFEKNRKIAQKEIIRVQRNDEDPNQSVNGKTGDSESSLELLRRGCNLIMFNYNKGSQKQSELKLIKYLDNLQLLSQDPLFVFSLSLQDTNLFKLHALSKMCVPVVR